MLIYGSLAGFLGNMLRALAKLPGGLGRFTPGRIDMLAGKSAVAGSLVGLWSPLVKVSFRTSWVYLVIPLVLVEPYWMALSNSSITIFHLPARNPLGGFLEMGRFLW